MIYDHETYSYGEDLDCPSGKGAFCTGTLPLKTIVLQKSDNNYETFNVSEFSPKTESPPCFGDTGTINIRKVHLLITIHIQ